MKYFAIATLILLCSAGNAQAFQVTSSSVTPLTDTVALYQLTFTQAIANNAAFYPVFGARPDSPHALDAAQNVGLVYDFVDPVTRLPYTGDTAPAYLGTTILLTTNGTLHDGQYVVPAGETATFTLWAFLNSSQPYDVLPALQIQELRVGIADTIADEPRALIERVDREYENLIVVPQ